jgi:hypothetical protein
MIMMITIFWDVTPLNMLDYLLRFGGKYYLHLHGTLPHYRCQISVIVSRVLGGTRLESH